MTRKQFMRNPEQWDYFFKQSLKLKEHAEVRTVKNGIILPLVPVDPADLPHPVLDAVCHGGVCRENGEFFAGHQRDLNVTPANLDCWEAYPVDEDDLVVRHEKVVFGGILYRHFGHAIADSFARLWYLISHPGPEKVVFLRFPYTFASDFDPMQLIGLLDIPDDRFEILEKPTRFDEIVVPDEAFISFNGHIPEFILPFQSIAENIETEGMPKKVYLSRRAYQADPSAVEKTRLIINEEYYESFFAARGYEVVNPETLPVREQIRVVRGADDIVSTIGTMTHLLLFAKPSVSSTILLRETPMFIQSNIDQVCGIDSYYVDAASSPLPVDHAHGPYLMIPNRFFRQYLDARGIDYAPEELECPDRDCLVMEFLRQWADMYRQPGTTDHHVADESMFDVIRRMNDTLYDSTFDEDEYRDADRLHPAQRERDELARQLADVRRELDELYSSKSWKLTKPLRAIVRVLHRGR